VTTVGDVRARDTYKRAKNEVEKARKALNRAEATELKKEKCKDFCAEKKYEKQLKARPALAKIFK